MVLEPSSPGSQFLFPEPSRRINTLKNSVSQEPLTENNSRASPGPLGRSPDHSKRSLALSRHLPMAPPAQPGCDSVSESQLTAGLYCSWKLSSPGEINMTQMALSWKKSSSLQNPQVSTVRETDPGCQCECYCPQLQAQACGAARGRIEYCSHSACPSFGQAILLCDFCHQGGSRLLRSHPPACYYLDCREEKGEGQPWACQPCLLTRKPSQPHLDCGQPQLCVPMQPSPSPRGMKGDVLVGLGLPHR